MEQHPFVAFQPCEPDGNIQLSRIMPKGFTHQHKNFELVYVLRGTAVRKMSNDAKVTVSAGNYFISNPLSAHGYEELKDFEVAVCLFLPEYINQALKDCPSISSLLADQVLRFGVHVDLPVADRVLYDSDGSVLRTIKQMEREQRERRTGYGEMLRCALVQILVQMVRTSEARIPHEAVHKVMAYLKAHYAEPLSLKKLSQLVGYTPQYLSSLFSDKVGISIQAFLQQMRIEEACRLLKRTPLSVAEVAAAVGYQDTRHFSKVFRRHQNISPNVYKKSINAKL